MRDEDRANIQAAKIHIDLFGADAGAPYADNHVELNGTISAPIPAKAGDSWRTQVIDLKPEQLI